MYSFAFSKAINEGVKIYDFLTGYEPYKLRWAENTRENYCINYYSSYFEYLSNWFPWILRKVGKFLINNYFKKPWKMFHK